MKLGRTMAELAQEIVRQAEVKRDYTAKLGGMRMRDEDGKVMLKLGRDKDLSVGEIAHQQIAADTGIYKPYYDRMLTEAPKLLAENVNEWWNRRPTEQHLVRTLDNRARAFLSDKFNASLDNDRLFETVYPILEDMELEIVSCQVTERRLYMKAVHKGISEKLPAGVKIGDGSHHIFKLDVGYPAVSIYNSEVGFGKIGVETGMLTGGCTNLAFFKQEGFRRRHVGARHDIIDGQFEELLSIDTKRQTEKATFMQIGDVIKNAFDAKVFKKRVERIASADNDKIDSEDLNKVIDVTVAKMNLSTGEGKSILRHLAEGGKLTRYGMFNAITRTAEDIESYDRASDLERIGADLIDLPATQWREIAMAA